ncbi:MAG: STN domain-containing protein, partial [Muribaculaceae bacterium]|nr:STN domain-containing protein [Muribaculaceae bacterium]
MYSSDLLKDVKVTVSAENKPLKYVLSEIFANTGIEFKIKGKNIILKKKKEPVTPKISNESKKHDTHLVNKLPDIDVKMLDEVVVLSRLESPAVESAEIGARKVTAEEVRNTPVLLGEADIIKTLQLEPGVSEGTEGLAGMYVHGGNADENLYMLENVPLYQVNHFAGLFSAFNTDVIKYIDFFKSSIPAKYDGRLSSFMDARLQNSNRLGHHGSARLGLTSGALNISGPIGKKTSYLLGIRRSWFDVLSIPLVAIANSASKDSKIRFNYYFMDINACVRHKFSPNTTAFLNIYFGDDNLKTGNDERNNLKEDYSFGTIEYEKYDFHWGNLLAQAGLNYRIKDNLSSEFTAAYTRFFSDMSHYLNTMEKMPSYSFENKTKMTTDNNINDWILRGDFDWRPNEKNHVRFGAGYTRHCFLPERTTRIYEDSTTYLFT